MDTEEAELHLLRLHLIWSIKHYADMLELKQINEETATILTNISKCSLMVVNMDLKDMRLRT